MRRPQRLIALAVLIALSGALAGCGGGGLSSFDPSDLLDFLDTKKKLPGERKPVFPEGVPGLEQGVPKNLYKGSRQEQIDQQNAEAAAAAAAPPPQEPKSKRGAKSKQPAAAARAPDAAQQAPDADAAPEEEGSTAAAPPAPKPKIVRRRTTAPPPDAPAQPAAQPPQQSAAPFPAPMPSGTFTR
jgi:predicted small lipoprotein YifL